jgi:hypothetical protein
MAPAKRARGQGDSPCAPVLSTTRLVSHVVQTSFVPLVHIGPYRKQMLSLRGASEHLLFILAGTVLLRRRQNNYREIAIWS